MTARRRAAARIAFLAPSAARPLTIAAAAAAVLALAPAAPAAATPAPAAQQAVAAPAVAKPTVAQPRAARPIASHSIAPHAVVCAETVALNSSRTCTIPDGGGSARYTVTTATADTIRFRAAIPVLFQARQVTLSTTGGTQLCAATSSGYGTVSCPVPAGTYVVEVVLDAAATVTTSIDSVLTSSCASAPDIAVGGAGAAVDVATPGGSWCADLPAATGDVFSLALDSAGDAGLAVVVYDATGAIRCTAGQVSAFARSLCTIAGGSAPFRIFATPTDDFAQSTTLLIARLNDPTGCGAGALDAFGAKPARRGALAPHQQTCFRATVAAGQRLGVHLLGVAGPTGTLTWTIYTAGGAPVCSGAVAAQVDSCAVPAAGPYTLLVSSLARDTVRFVVALTNLSDGTGCTPFASTAWDAAPMTPTLTEPGQVDCLTFTMGASGASSPAARLTLFDGQRNVTRGLLTKADGTSVCAVYGRIDCAATSGVTYRLIVTSSSLAASDYRAWATDTTSTAGCAATSRDALNSAPARQGTFSSDRIALCWTFTGAAATTYLVNAGALGNPNLSVSWEIRTPSGQSVCRQFLAGPCVLPATGSYLLVVAPASAAESSTQLGAATVGFWRLTAATGCAPIGLSFSAAATATSISAPYEADCRRFAAAAGDRVVTRLVPVGSGVVQRIVDDNGATVCFATSYGCVLTGPGPYRIVSYVSGAATPNYSYRVASLTTHNGCATLAPTVFGKAPGRHFDLADPVDLACYVVTRTSTASGFYGVRLFGRASAGANLAEADVYAPGAAGTCHVEFDPTRCLTRGPGAYLVVVASDSADSTGTIGVYDYTADTGCRVGPSGAFGPAPTLGRINGRGAVDCLTTPFAALDKVLLAYGPSADVRFTSEVIGGDGDVVCTFGPLGSAGDCGPIPRSAAGSVRVLTYVRDDAPGAYTGVYRIHLWKLKNPTGCVDLGSLRNGFGPLTGTLADGHDATCYYAQAKGNGVLDIVAGNDDDPNSPPSVRILNRATANTACHPWPNPGCVLSGGAVVIYVIARGQIDSGPVRFHAQADCISAGRCGP